MIFLDLTNHCFLLADLQLDAGWNSREGRGESGTQDHRDQRAERRGHCP